MNITDTIHDLQNVLEQQNTIYKTNQNLHFDWLQSVLFQLKVYDQSNKGDIKVNKSESIIDIDQINYNHNIQQQNVLNSCKKQISKINKQKNMVKQNQKSSENSCQKQTQKPDENLNQNQVKLHVESASPISAPKAIPRARNRRKNSLQKKAASTSFIQSPIEMAKNNAKKNGNMNCNGIANRKINGKKGEVASPTHLLKFVDKDSLLSISQSSDSCVDDFYTENDDQYRMCQSLPSKETPLTISCNITELTQSVSSFQEKWQEMVEEKKRSSLLPKPPVGSLFTFDDAPESYQMTDSDEKDEFFFSDEDDEIHEEDPLEIHGKMIPSWARKEKVEEQLINQQKEDPDKIFTEMPKHCVLSHIFEFSNGVGSSILAEGQDEDDDNYEELMSY